MTKLTVRRVTFQTQKRKKRQKRKKIKQKKVLPMEMINKRKVPKIKKMMAKNRLTGNS